MVQSENGLEPYFTFANLHLHYGPFNASCTKMDVEVELEAKSGGG